MAPPRELLLVLLVLVLGPAWLVLVLVLVLGPVLLVLRLALALGATDSGSWAEPGPRERWAFRDLAQRGRVPVAGLSQVPRGYRTRYFTSLSSTLTLIQWPRRMVGPRKISAGSSSGSSWAVSLSDAESAILTHRRGPRALGLVAQLQQEGLTAGGPHDRRAGREAGRLAPPQVSGLAPTGWKAAAPSRL